MKILITGGAGFIGSHVVDQYIHAGHQVVLIDNLSLSTDKYINKQAKVYRTDLRDTDKIINIFQLEKPDIVNHHAADSRLRLSFTEIKKTSDNNIGGTLSIIEAAKKYPPKKILFASSGGAIYSSSHILHTEGENCIPASPYGIGKKTCEELFNFCYKYYQIPYIALRYGNVYGPRQSWTYGNGIVAILINNTLNGGETNLIGKGTDLRDYVYIDDVARANLLALESEYIGPMNIATAKGRSVITIAKLISNSLKKDCKLIRVPQYIYGEQKKNVLDITLADEVMGWKPTVSIKKGVEKTVDWYQRMCEGTA